MRGLHLLGVDTSRPLDPYEKETDYSPYLKAGLEGLGSAVKGILEGAKSKSSAAPPTEKPKSGSFWTDPLVGPIPGWGVVAGGAGVGAILWRVLRGKWGV